MMQMSVQMKLADFQKPYRRGVRKWLGYAGGLVRKIAKRSLRQATKKRNVDELTDDELDTYVIRTRIAEQEGLPKPEMPDRVSKPGRPPLLHGKKSPLKHLLLYAIDEAAQDVVIGPERARKAIADRIEKGSGKRAARPFMAPAEEKARPMLAGAWSGAFS